VKKLERAWMDAITQLGCVVCLVHERIFSPSEPHHLLSGGRRRGHLYTIPLCPPHHRFGLNNGQATSRDQCRRRFEERYGASSHSDFPLPGQPVRIVSCPGTTV
jgi:hypothetical protein